MYVLMVVVVVMAVMGHLKICVSTLGDLILSGYLYKSSNLVKAVVPSLAMTEVAKPRGLLSSEIHPDLMRLVTLEMPTSRSFGNLGRS